MEAPQKCIVFLGCWITDDVSVRVFTVEAWITNSLRGVIGVPACHPDKKPVKLSWLSYHSVFILVLFASSHQRKIDRWSVSYHWHLFFKSHPASSAVSPHTAMTFPPNIWTWTAFAFQPAPATAAELLWPRWPQFCHTIPPLPEDLDLDCDLRLALLGWDRNHTRPLSAICAFQSRKQIQKKQL